MSRTIKSRLKSWRPTSIMPSSSRRREPTGSLAASERYVTLARAAKAEPVLVLTKADLAADPGRLLSEAEVAAPGLRIDPGLRPQRPRPRRAGLRPRTREDDRIDRLLGRRQVDPVERPRGQIPGAHRRSPRGRRAGQAHDDEPTAVPARRRRARHRHAGSASELQLWADDEAGTFGPSPKSRSWPRCASSAIAAMRASPDARCARRSRPASSTPAATPVGAS